MLGEISQRAIVAATLCLLISMLAYVAFEYLRKMQQWATVIGTIEETRRSAGPESNSTPRISYSFNNHEYSIWLNEGVWFGGLEAMLGCPIEILVNPHSPERITIKNSDQIAGPAVVFVIFNAVIIENWPFG